jgi:para-aminobenzoate synthetase component I
LFDRARNSPKSMIQPTTATVRLDTTHPTGAAGWTTPHSIATEWLVCDPAGQCQWITDGRCARQWHDPKSALNWLDHHRLTTPNARWIGYLAYELAAHLDGVPPRHPSNPAFPLFIFSSHPNPICPAQPTEPGRVAPAHFPNPPSAENNFPDSSPQTYAHPTPQRPLRVLSELRGELSYFPAQIDQYESAVARVIDFIRAGDIFQANIAHTLKVSLAAPPTEIYRRLIAKNGDWYSALLDYGSFAIASNSPELFLRVEADGQVISRPIKGTRPTAPGMASALLASEKDTAELNMIIDVQRNDLGRICAPGSVRVTEPRTIESHPTILHGVATIQGRLRPNITLVDLLTATFPCGSVTGAPKIRAMQIINDLEPTRRNVYCGAIGYLDPDGSIQFNVAIRTMTLLGDSAYLPVGAGIVADSDPAAEYEETLVKARSILAALSATERPLVTTESAHA